MGSDELPRRVSLGKAIIAEAQQGELNRILNKFDEVVTEKLGQTSAACHVIDTGQSLPVQSNPYKIVLGMRANSNNCEWGANFPTYLGYELGLGKIKLHEVRVKAIRDYKKTLHQAGFTCIS